MIARRRALALGVAAGLLIGSTGAICAQPLPKRIVLGTVADSREVDAGIVVLREAYARLGIQVDVRRYAGGISLQKSDAGEVDGEVHRIDGIAERFPNLVQVPVPINYFDIAVFSMRPGFRPTAWRDLAPFQVGVVRGILAVEQATRGIRTRQVDTYAELFPLLVRGEVDAVAAPVVDAHDAIRHHREMKEVVQNAILDSYLLYHYLHRSRAALVPAIEPVLKSMLRDGTTARLMAEANADLVAARRSVGR